MKVVQFQYPNLQGLITYTGIGRVDRDSTAAIVLNWLTGSIFSSLLDVGKFLEGQGRVWLRGLQSSLHTFVVAGFENSRVAMAIVSNFESFDYRPQSTPGLLQTSIRYSDRKCILRVTGSPDAVPKERVKLLRRTIDTYPDQTSRTKQIMLDLIARGAQVYGSGGTISPNGAAFSVRADGSGQLTLTEPSATEIFSIINGSPMPSASSLLASLGLSGGQLAGYSYSGFGSGSTLAPPERCILTQIPDGGNDFTLTQIGTDQPSPHRAHSIREDGTVLLGTRLGEELASRQYGLWKMPALYQGIMLPAPNYADSGKLDENENAFLNIQHPGKPSIPLRWSPRETTALATVNNLPGSIAVASHTGWVGGSVEVFADTTRSDRQKPARWDPSGTLDIADLAEGIAGSCIAIRDDGLALLQLHRDVSPVFSAVWERDGEINDLNLPSHHVCVGMSADQIFVARSDVLPARAATISEDGTRWKPMGLPTGFEPTSVLLDGTVTGRLKRDGFLQAWISDLSGSYSVLPGFRYHDHSITDSNGDGWLVGTASADFCSHAVLWRPSH